MYEASISVFIIDQSARGLNCFKVKGRVVKGRLSALGSYKAICLKLTRNSFYFSFAEREGSDDAETHIQL